MFGLVENNDTNAPTGWQEARYRLFTEVTVDDIRQRELEGVALLTECRISRLMVNFRLIST